MRQARPRKVTIGLCGKYVHLHDAYKSIIEACVHGGVAAGVRTELKWIDSEDVVSGNVEQAFEGVEALLVPGGFGQRGTEGMVEAVRHARETGLPFLGICLGFQCMLIDFARNVCGLTKANSSELDSATPDPVIDLLPDQHGVEEKGGTMRLGAYACDILPGTRAAEAYGTETVRERHRHRYEMNNAYRDKFESRGLVMSGINPERNLVEIAELSDHPWFVGVQFHPELRSRPRNPHPVFRAFVRAAVQRKPEEAMRARS